MTVGPLVVGVFAWRSGICGFDSPAGRVTIGQLVVWWLEYLLSDQEGVGLNPWRRE